MDALEVTVDRGSMGDHRECDRKRGYADILQLIRGKRMEPTRPAVCTLQGLIVTEHGDAVSRNTHVELDPVAAGHGEGGGEGRQGVFRGMGPVTAGRETKHGRPSAGCAAG